MSAAANPDRLTTDTMNGLLREVCARIGVDGRDPQLIKFTNNAVFRLPHARVVVRIAGSATMRSRVRKVVQVARWLATHDLPAVRLRSGIEQPLDLRGHLATVWTEVRAAGPAPTGTDLAQILRCFHDLPDPPFNLPPWRPLEEIRQRLAEPEDLPTDDHAFLWARCDEIEHELSGLRFVLPPGPIHGDPFLGNLIPASGGAVLCDFDATCTGPREWDLTPVAVGKLRFDYPGDTHGDLARSYGFDVTTWDGFPVLRRLRELQLVSSVIPILATNPSIRTQWRHRLDAVKADDTATRWTTYR